MSFRGLVGPALAAEGVDFIDLYVNYGDDWSARVERFLARHPADLDMFYAWCADNGVSHEGAEVRLATEDEIKEHDACPF